MPKELEKIYKSCMASKTYANKSPKEKESICRVTAVKVSKQKWKKHSKESNGLSVEEVFFGYPMVVTESKLSDNKEMEITLLSTTSDYKDKEAMRKYHEYKIGNKILWDHKHPVREEDGVMIDGELRRYPPFGRITESWLEDLDIVGTDGENVLGNYIKAKLYGWSPAHEAFQKMVLEFQESGDSLGGSDHFYNYLDDNNNLVFQLDEETSITPAPVCDICRITDAKMLSKTKGDNMENVKTPPETVEETKVEPANTEPIELSTTADKGTDEHEAISPEVLQKTIVQMNSIIENQKAKIAEHEKTISNNALKTSSLVKELSDAKARIEFITTKEPLLKKIELALGDKYNDPKIKEQYEAMSPELLKVQIDILSEATKAADKVEKVPVQNDPTPDKVASDEEKLNSGDLFDQVTKQLMDIARKDALLVNQ
jgi:hypothetical protein